MGKKSELEHIETRSKNIIDMNYLSELVENHLKENCLRYEKYQRLYEDKVYKPDDSFTDVKVKNKVIAEDIYLHFIDKLLVCLLGNPIRINHIKEGYDSNIINLINKTRKDNYDNRDESVQNILDYIFLDNDKDDLFMEWGKEAMIKGLSHILVYQNEESRTKLMRVAPENMILVYKNYSIKELEYAIHIHEDVCKRTKSLLRYIEVYSNNRIQEFIQTKTVDKGGKYEVSDFNLVTERSHIFERVPVATFYNNEEEISDFDRLVYSELYDVETLCSMKLYKMEKAIRNLLKVMLAPIIIITDKSIHHEDFSIEFSRNINI